MEHKPVGWMIDALVETEQRQNWNDNHPRNRGAALPYE